MLFGDVNPGGKLPVTLARNAGQMPIFYDVKPSARRGYLFDTTEPLYPFGWGLATRPSSSARRASRRPRSDANATRSRSPWKCATRASARGDETVQLYVRDKVSSVTRPVKQLKGFQRVTPRARRDAHRHLPLDAREASRMWDEPDAAAWSSPAISKS